jgi:hypothetical protein
MIKAQYRKNMRAENLKQRRSPEAYNRPDVYMLLDFKRCYIVEPSNISRVKLE